MAHLPRLRACGRTAIVGASIFGRMFGVHAREHLFLTQEPVVVLLGLGVEACIVIRVVALRTGRGGENRFAQTTHAPGTRSPIPAIVTAIRIGVAITDQPGASSLLR